jgi:hypothetical protein
MLSTQLHLVSRLEKSGAVSPALLHVSMAWTGKLCGWKFRELRFRKVLRFVEKFHSILCCGPSRRACSHRSKPLSSQNVKSKLALIPNFNLLVPGVDHNPDGLIQTLWEQTWGWVNWKLRNGLSYMFGGRLRLSFHLRRHCPAFELSGEGDITIVLYRIIDINNT